MRAVRFHQTGGPEVLRLEEIQRPRPGTGEVVIRVVTAGVNQTDSALRSGAIPAGLPVIPGSEVAGTVIEVGEGVDPRLAGARVAAMSHTGMGGYAEELATSAEFVVPIPDRLEFDCAAAVAAQGTAALGLLSSAGLQPGESVLVGTATGGVGSMLVQLAKQRGATVVATAPGEAKVALAQSLGADFTVDHTEPGWDRRIREAFGGDSLDVVLETAGGASTQVPSGLLTPGLGRMVLYGEIRPTDVLRSDVLLTGLGTVAWRRPGFLRKTLERVLLLAAQGRLDPVIAARYPLAEASEAHRFIEDRAFTGKALLHVD